MKLAQIIGEQYALYLTDDIFLWYKAEINQIPMAARQPKMVMMLKEEKWGFIYCPGYWVLIL